MRAATCPYKKAKVEDFEQTKPNEANKLHHTGEFLIGGSGLGALPSLQRARDGGTEDNWECRDEDKSEFDHEFDDRMDQVRCAQEV